MNAPKENQYLLLFRGSDWYNTVSAEELQQAMNRFKDWFDRLSESGVLKGAQPLVPAGKIVSGKQGRVVADGPFAESKEAIGGYFLLAVNSLDEAVRLAQGCPALEYGAQVEVRPVAEECPMAARARQLQPEEQAVAA